MKTIFITAFTILFALPVLAAEAEKSPKEGETVKPKDGVIIIEGEVSPKEIHPLIEKMRKGLSDYEIVAERMRNKVQEERREQKRLARNESKPVKKYRPRVPDVSTEDLIKSLEEMGIPREAIKIEGQDLHDYIFQFICVGKKNIEISPNMNITKEQIKDKIQLNCDQ